MTPPENSPTPATGRWVEAILASKKYEGPRGPRTPNPTLIVRSRLLPKFRRMQEERQELARVSNRVLRELSRARGVSL